MDKNWENWIITNKRLMCNDALLNSIFAQLMTFTFLPLMSSMLSFKNLASAFSMVHLNSQEFSIIIKLLKYFVKNTGKIKFQLKQSKGKNN